MYGRDYRFVTTIYHAHIDSLFQYAWFFRGKQETERKMVNSFLNFQETEVWGICVLNIQL